MVITKDGIALSRIVTIYNGVDIARFAPPGVAQRSAARAQLGLGARDFVVGMVAAFRPEKNHDTFFAGLLQALPHMPDLKVLAVSAGPKLAQWREQIAVMALGIRIVFTGDVGDVVPYLWAMDAGCLTPGSNEGFSNAIIEQMAVGLPMIVTAVDGNAEAVVDGESGRVIAPFDTAALARALIELYADPSRTAAWGRAARERVEEKFSVVHMCAEHARLYRSLYRSEARAASHGAERD